MVFTDVQGSTKLWEALKEDMERALFIHNGVMRRVIAECGGYEVKTEGDAFMVAFQTAHAAVKWCLDAQEALVNAEWPTDGALLDQPEASVQYDDAGNQIWSGLRVRMGVHVGEPRCVRDPSNNILK